MKRVHTIGHKYDIIILILFCYSDNQGIIMLSDVSFSMIDVISITAPVKSFCDSIQSPKFDWLILR